MGWRVAAGKFGSAIWALAALLSPMSLPWQLALVTESTRPSSRTTHLMPGCVTALPRNRAPSSLYLQLYLVCMSHTEKPTQHPLSAHIPVYARTNMHKHT